MSNSSFEGYILLCAIEYIRAAKEIELSSCVLLHRFVMQLADDLSKVGLFYVLLHAVEQLKKKGFYYIASFGDEARW